MSKPQRIDSYQATLLDYFNSLVGINYKIDGRDLDSGVDCYGLVYVVYTEVFNIEMPLLNTGYHKSINQVASIKRDEWVAVTEPMVGDVILFRNGGERHVGLWLGNNKMIHSSNNTNVCIENYERARWKNKKIGIFGHKCRRKAVNN